MASEGIGDQNNGFTFYWKIKHFSLYSLLTESIIRSPVFRIEEIANTEWCLYLHPNCSENNLVLNIHRLKDDEGPKEIYMDVKLFFLRANGDKTVMDIKHVFFMKKRFLADTLKVKKCDEKLFLPNDTLTVGCFIKENSNNFPSSIECIACTKISTEKFLFEIPFSIFQEQIVAISKGSVSKKYPNFKILLKPFRSAHNTEFITVTIVMGKSSSEVLCKCKLSVEDKENKSLFLFEASRKYEANFHESPWSLPNSVISTEKLTNFSIGSDFILLCVLVVSDGTYSSHIKNSVYSM